MSYAGNLQLTPKAGATIILNGLITANSNRITYLSPGISSNDATNLSQTLAMNYIFSAGMLKY